MALAQIRLVAASLLSRYRVKFLSGVDWGVVERDMKDQLTARPGRCLVVFERR